MKKVKERGITLIALVVTIVVLLIIAGVSIATLTGDNGIITQAIQGKEESKESSAVENVRLAWTNLELGSKIKDKQIKDAFSIEKKLNSDLSEEGIVTDVVYSDGVITFKYQEFSDTIQYEMKFYPDGKVEVVNKVVVDPLITGNFAKLVTSKNYGDTVRYEANGISEWKIFYKDPETNNVFLIASDYLPSIKIPEDIGMERVENQYRTSWKSLHITEIDTSVAEKYKLSGLSTFNKTYRSFYAVAALMYTEAWGIFADNDLAESAIGSPTLDMWIESWNEKYKDTLDLQATEAGYKVGLNSETFANRLEKADMQAKEGYNDKLYYPYTEEFEDNGKPCVAYRLASPSATEGSSMGQYVMRINADGRVYYDAYYTSRYAARPVVCIKSEVNGTKTQKGWILSN